MISLHAHDAQDWSGNGICALFSEVCDVKEMAAGLYELELVHPITDDGRALSIKNGMLIKAPVPARETPLITNWHEGNEGQPGHVIYETNITTSQTGGYVRIYTKATTDSKVLQKLRNHVEFIFHNNIGSNWVKGTSKEGTTGYLYKANVRYVRTEAEIPGTPGYNTVVQPRQIREQLFRVFDVNVDAETNKVKALARHIFYDQLGNFVKTYDSKDVPLQAALDAMSADLINAHDFSYYTNIARSITAEWALKNAVQVICDPDEGAAAKLKAQVVRDNYDTFLLENAEIDRGVVIEAGKNLLGVKSKVNDENVITRIMPYGTDKAGKILLLPEVYLDSPYRDNYPTIRAYPLQVQDAAEKDASGDNPAVTKEQAYEKMRQAAQDMFDAGCDLPNIDIQVDFVHLGDTIEYAQYKDLQQVFLHDTVTVKHGRLGMLYKTQVIGYDFDAALGRYNSVTLGNIKNGAELGVIAGFQLPNGGISGMKLVPGSVGSGQLRELSILAAHIGLAQIVNAHIQDATIDKVKVKDFTAEVAAIAVAKIGEAWIDAAWIDQLTTNVVSIVTANIDTLITNNANIGWAQIANLVAAVADITLAQIQTANIGWAQIGGLVAGTAMFTQGVSGQLYCADLMVTDANIESLSANKIAGGLGVFGQIMIMGQDGKMYELVVGSLGELTAQEKQLDGDNVGDYVLTDRNMSSGTLTSRVLNVQQIFGDSALVRQLIAQNIDTDTLFANLGYINALKTHLIQSDIGQYLDLQSNEGIRLLVDEKIGGIEIGGTNLIRGSRLWPAAKWGWWDGTGVAWWITNAYSTGDDAVFIHAWEGTSLHAVLYQSVPVRGSTEYTLSIDWVQHRGNVTFRCYESGSGMSSIYHNAHSANTSVEAAFFDKSTTFTTHPACKSITVELIVAAGSYAYFRKPKLEEGNKATAWSPAPEDIEDRMSAAEVKLTPEQILLAIIAATSSKIQLTALQALIESDSVAIRTLTMEIVRRDAAGNVYLAIDDSGISTEYPISSPQILSPSVLGVYRGSMYVPWKGSISATLDSLPKYLAYDVVITIPAGTYSETVVIDGVVGGMLRFVSSGAVVINGGVLRRNCASNIQFEATGGNSLSILHNNAHIAPVFADGGNLRLSGVRVTGKARANAEDGSTAGVYARDGAVITLVECTIERTKNYAVIGDTNCQVDMYQCNGGQAGGDYTTVQNLGHGVIITRGGGLNMYNTCPMGATAAYGSWQAPAPIGSPTPTASPGATPIVTTRTLRYTLSESGTLKKDNGATSWLWMSTGLVWQADNTSNYDSRIGVYILSGAANIAANIGSGTITAAKLKVQRYTAYGSSDPVIYNLHYHGYTSKAGVPSGGATRPAMVNTDINISLARDEVKMIDLPSGLFALLANGTIKGFGNLNSGSIISMAAVCELEISVQGGP